MPAPISLEVITPAGLVFQADVWSVRLPTPQGQIGILPNHLPVVTIVAPGRLIIQRREGDSTQEYVECAGGFVEIDGRRVRILADSAEHKSAYTES